METPEWISKSLCKNRHVDLWYPPLDSDAPDKYYAVAREICKRCPVWRNCLSQGITETWGMWGGLTPLERTVLNTTKVPRTNALRPHGTWMRYRQGCTCEECIEASNTKTEEININSVPYMNENLGDLDTLRFLLFDQ